MSRDLLTGTTLRQRSTKSVTDPKLQRSLEKAAHRFTSHKADAVAALHNYEEMRLAARWVRSRIVSRLPELLDQFATNVEKAGGQVFFAADAAEANRYVTELARRTGARTAVKSKSMATEEIHLNEALDAAGVEVVETDLGEWIIQLADDAPSHIIAPAIHKTRDDVAELFRALDGGARPDLSNVPEELCAFAREQLRKRFLAADLGISGVNFAVAESGSIVIVTNEGNGRLSTSLPRVHVAVMGAERLAETWDDLDLLLGLLTRAASGLAITTYVNAITGPRRGPEGDGPEELHVVILDNGRSEIAGSEFGEMLDCIRCGACLNVCPVYRQIGGHGYGWVYSGPMGAVLTPLLNQAHEAQELQNASSLCGACWEACPVGIPLQDLLLGLRRKKATMSSSSTERAAWKAWAETWSRPGAYRAATRSAAVASRMVPSLLVPKRWSEGRTVPRAPSGQSFRAWFDKTQKGGE